jgi:hypothetical protein
VIAHDSILLRFTYPPHRNWLCLTLDHDFSGKDGDCNMGIDSEHSVGQKGIYCSADIDSPLVVTKSTRNRLLHVLDDKRNEWRLLSYK